MHPFKSLCCYYCNAEIIRLTEAEIIKFNGFNFTCECCGHQNHLEKSDFLKGTENEDPYLNICTAESTF